jgi:hypothetical protein
MKTVILVSALALSACMSQQELFEQRQAAFEQHQAAIKSVAVSKAYEFWGTRQNDLHIFYDHEVTECGYQPSDPAKWHGRNRKAECLARLGTLQDFTNAKIAEYADGMAAALNRGEQEGLAQAEAHDADCHDRAYSGWPLVRSSRYAHAYYSGCMSVP